MASEIELKPCPFCGAEAELLSGYYNDLQSAQVHCMNCIASTYADSDRYTTASVDELEAMVVDAWNRRAGDGK